MTTGRIHSMFKAPGFICITEINKNMEAEGVSVTEC